MIISLSMDLWTPITVHFLMILLEKPLKIEIRVILKKFFFFKFSSIFEDASLPCKTRRPWSSYIFFYNSSTGNFFDDKGCACAQTLYYENTAVEPCAICLILGMALNQAKLNFLKAALVRFQGFKKLKQIWQQFDI